MDQSATAHGHRTQPAIVNSFPISGSPVLEENSMRDFIFILLTLAIFGIFALIVKGVERM
jgi:hypothetical protein